MTPRPRWRWWLNGCALWLHGRTRWQWALDLFGWTVLPDWVGAEGPPYPIAEGEYPF